MNDNFTGIDLYFTEQLKLFVMRFRKKVPGSFLEPSLRGFLTIKFVKSEYPFVDTVKNDNQQEALYSLTDRYFRYCVYRRRKFFDSKVWPLVISVIASVITSIITTLITARLTIQAGP